MGTHSATDRWRIDRSETIDWREWGEEFVVRVESRAETHLLSAAAGAALLALLDGRQMTLDALYAEAFQEPDSDSSGGPPMSVTELDSLRTIVIDLERLGIVTRLSS